MQAGPVELGDVGRAAELGPVGVGQHPQAVPAHDLEPGVRVGQPLAEPRVARPTVGRPRARRSPAQLALEGELLAERRRAALERQQAHRHPPSLVHAAHDEVGRRAGPGEEHLVELGGAGQLDDRADLDAGRVHADEQERDALVLGRVAVGAGQQEAPVAPVRQRRPHLLPVDHPLVAVEDGPGRDVGQVRPGVGLGVALAPQLLARARWRAGTAAAARGCRSGSASGRSAPRRCGRAGRDRRPGRTPRSR